MIIDIGHEYVAVICKNFTFDLYFIWLGLEDLEDG
jgi:hypothetical protein